VSPGDSIQRAIDRHPEGTWICLSGTYRIASTIIPKDGTVLQGPAELVAAAGVTQGVDATKAARVQIRRLTMHGYTERAFKCGPRSLVRDSFFHHNGRNGMGGGECHGLRVIGTEIADNGNPGDLGSGSAGIKIAGSRNAVIRGNLVHDNLGVGIWCDVDCRDWLVERNRVFRNSRKGIFFEKGDGAMIRFNVARSNNASLQRVGGGICAVSSVNVRIHDNLLGGNHEHGIKVWDDDRGYVLSGVLIDGNDLAGDDLSGCSESGVECSANRDVGP